MKTIEVLVLPNGETKVEAHGYIGDECTAALSPIEKALGSLTKITNKPEYYQCSTQQQIQAKQ